jgi:2-polyprenyl-3-methyl-5-hydroxy-6-metoxy-1,4-benzoquinol methylase
MEGDFSTFGVDINHAALRDTAQKIAPHTHLDIASAEELPFASGSFGVVVIKHVVEHLLDPRKAILELGRVLAPGGILILSTPNLDSYGRKWKGSRWIGYQDKTHISLKPPAEWLDLIQNEANLKVLKKFSDGFWDVPYVSWLPAGLQKLLFGSLGGFQAISGMIFLPVRMGESIIVISQKPE